MNWRMRNKYEIHGDTVVIHLNDTFHTLVDTEDLERVAAAATRYRVNVTKRNRKPRVRGETWNGKTCSFYLHRFVIGAKPGDSAVDHIDGNSLDNRKRNLRLVTGSLNNLNLNGPTRNNQTGFLGVTRNREKYGARIWLYGVQHWLGTYDTPQEAAYVASKARKEIIQANISALTERGAFSPDGFAGFSSAFANPRSASAPDPTPSAVSLSVVPKDNA